MEKCLICKPLTHKNRKSPVGIRQSDLPYPETNIRDQNDPPPTLLEEPELEPEPEELSSLLRGVRLT